MNREELVARVDEIISKAGDDERAHSMEDVLHLHVIQAFCPKWVRVEIERLCNADFGRFCA